MITNFETITYDLTEYEFSLIRVLITGFNHRTKENPITADEILISMFPKYKITGARLRKLCNFIRSEGMIPLIASKCGYYVSHDPIEINNQIKSLEERAAAILNSANGLKKFI